MASRPNGDYWREANSVRVYGVILAYLHNLTGSHIASMKIVLAVWTIFYLWTAQLFFALFTRDRWEAVLFAVVSAFAVSFGISSWGVTDGTALLSRTLALPVILLSFWFYFRFQEYGRKYLAFTFLILGSLLHLSCFYALAILVALALWSLVSGEEVQSRVRSLQFLLGLSGALALLYYLERSGVSVAVFELVLGRLLEIPTQTPITGQPQGGARLTASQAWEIELALRPWRNMPLPLVNLANVLSSYWVIFCVAVAGVWKARASGFTKTDRAMLVILIIIPIIAFVPQTFMWGLRSFAPIYPMNFEEIRTIGFIMVPSLYFVLRLFRGLRCEVPKRKILAAAVVLLVVGFPLGMKSLSTPFREGILAVMCGVNLVACDEPASLANARSALGIAHPPMTFYYSAKSLLAWLDQHTPEGATILSDRDELILLRDRNIVGPRQVAAVPKAYKTELPDHVSIYLATQQAMASRDLKAVTKLAEKWGADYAVVPWHVSGAVYADQHFSVLQFTAK